MSEQNPYAAPQTNVANPIIGDEQFKSLDFKELKKLYYRSCNVSSITFLLVLGLLFISTLFFIPDFWQGQEVQVFRYILIGITVFYTITIVGLFLRTSWGRIMGIIVCFMALINIPFGTIIGAFGLFAFFCAPQLFGSNRITHKALKTEFKLQKKAQKMRKKAMRSK